MRKLEVKRSRPLFRRHDAASRTKYQDAVQLARGQKRVLAGTPGTLKQRTQGSRQYWVREHIRVDGAKVDEYLGPVETMPAERVDDLRAEIDLAKALASASAMLRLLGFQRVEREPAAVLAVFFNHGLHRAGLVLVGSHAYGSLLNELGVQASAYRTQDLDVARATPLALALPADGSFGALLNESGLGFVPVPGMPSNKPSGSFKLPGAGKLMVDLLVPGKEPGRVVEVRDLGGYAQTVPLLDFLVDAPLESAALSPNQIVPVLLPAPERFVLHKLFSAESRRADRSKISKDREQAAVAAAALEEESPGRLRAAWSDVPRAHRAAIRHSAQTTAGLLAGVHPQVEDLLRELAAAR
jgi:hypothetical protein